MTANIHKEIPLWNRWLASVLYVFQYAFPEVKFLENLRQNNVRRICETLKKNLKKQGLERGGVYPVERRKNLGEQEFIREYMNKSLPVIFDQEALDWDSSKKWTMDYFAEKFGDKKVSFTETKGMVERDLDRTGDHEGWVVVEQMGAKDFIDSIKKGSKKYLRFGQLTDNERELISDLNNDWLAKMRRTFFGVNYLTFVGGGGRTTPIHAGISALFFVMAEGEKKWTFFSPSSSALVHPRRAGRDYNFSDVNINSPDPDKYPGFELLTRLECTLKKGDVLWLPTWWWHEVETLSDSWAIRYGFGNFRTFLRYPSFVFVRLFLCKPSFFKIVFHKVFLRTGKKPSMVHNRVFTD